jgi:hypothetical protein
MVALTPTSSISPLMANSTPRVRLQLLLSLLLLPHFLFSLFLLPPCTSIHACTSTTNKQPDSTLSISSITTPGIFAFSYCNFYTNGPKSLATNSTGSIIEVGPPQPIYAVACAPTGANNTCLPDYCKSFSSIPFSGLWNWGSGGRELCSGRADQMNSSMRME